MYVDPDGLWLVVVGSAVIAYTMGYLTGYLYAKWR